MTNEQFDRLIHVLGEDRSYTLAGAADWYMLVAMVTVVSALIIYIWQDLKITIKDHRFEQKKDLDDEIAERKAQDDLIWEAMRHCQDDCCPRGTKALQGREKQR